MVKMGVDNSPISGYNKKAVNSIHMGGWNMNLKFLKKRLLKAFGIGLAVIAALYLLPSLFATVVTYFVMGKWINSFDNLQDWFHKYPFILLGTASVCLLWSIAPPAAKMKRVEMDAAEYKPIRIIETAAGILGLIALFSLAKYVYAVTKSKELFIFITVVLIAGTVLYTIYSFFTPEGKAETKKNPQVIIGMWIGMWILTFAVLLIPFRPISGGFSLPSFSLFHEEKAEANVVTDSIDITIDPFRSNAYLAKCTIRNTGNADAKYVSATLYYYDASGVKQIGSFEDIDRLAAGKSYSFTLRFSVHNDMFYPYGVRDPYLDINYLSDS